MSRQDDIRRMVGKPRSTLARWGHARSTKHMQTLPYEPAIPVPCMFYMADRPARVCGVTETQWDEERTTWLCSTHRKEMDR
jgi:hypothetical protein